MKKTARPRIVARDARDVREKRDMFGLDSHLASLVPQLSQGEYD
jgi:hypothetical protein